MSEQALIEISPDCFCLLLLYIFFKIPRLPLLSMIILSAVQSSTTTGFHNVVLFMVTSTMLDTTMLFRYLGCHVWRFFLVMEQHSAWYFFPLTDLGGGAGKLPHPVFKFFQFHAVLTKFGNIMCWWPLGGWSPNLGEILDPPLFSYT